jgi:hypothetical protein
VLKEEGALGFGLGLRFVVGLSKFSDSPSTMENLMKSWDEARFRDTEDRKLKLSNLIKCLCGVKIIAEEFGRLPRQKPKVDIR